MGIQLINSVGQLVKDSAILGRIQPTNNQWIDFREHLQESTISLLRIVEDYASRNGLEILEVKDGG